MIVRNRVQIGTYKHAGKVNKQQAIKQNKTEMDCELSNL
jgi:hypothetical protein